MNYFQQIAERLLQPGTFLLVLGAILVYTSGIVARKLFRAAKRPISSPKSSAASSHSLAQS